MTTRVTVQICDVHCLAYAFNSLISQNAGNGTGGSACTCFRLGCCSLGPPIVSLPFPSGAKGIAWASLPSRKLSASTVNDTRSTALRSLRWVVIIDVFTFLTTVCCCLLSLAAKPAQEQGLADGLRTRKSVRPKVGCRCSLPVDAVRSMFLSELNLTLWGVNQLRQLFKLCDVCSQGCKIRSLMRPWASGTYLS